MIKRISYIAKAEYFFNFAEITGVLLVLALAFVFQIVLSEPPCPLCLLQRVGFFGIAFGFLLNLRYGFRPSHYAIVILSAIYTSFVALRQIALHVVPGTGAYGNAVFGLHLYTWSFIISMVICIVTTLMFSIDRQYIEPRFRGRMLTWLTSILFTIAVILLSINLVAIFMECGFKECSDNPAHYLM